MLMIHQILEAYIILFNLINLSKQTTTDSVSKITLTIEGNGDQKILSDDYDFNPDYIDNIYVNNDPLESPLEYIGKTIYHLTEPINIITIIFKNQITSCEHMFDSLSNIIYIDLSNFNSSLVTSMNSMFYGCSALKSLNLNNFITSEVIDMSFMFTGCNSLNSLNLNSFDTSKVFSMSFMFSECSSLTSLNLDNFDTSEVFHMTSMFWGCSGLTSLNLNNFITSKVTDMYGMFCGCNSLISLDLNSFNTSKVITMSYMFRGCSSLKSSNIDNFDTSEVLHMSGMFWGCSILTSFHLDNFNTLKVTDMSGMFYESSSLITLNLNNFYTYEVTDISYMFSGCSSLISLYLNNFDISNVNSMFRLFYGCSSLKSLYLLSFDTSNVNDMYGMFWGCSSLMTLNLINFYTSNVYKMSKMFQDCNSMLFLNIHNFDAINVNSVYEIFFGCNPELTICINLEKAYMLSSEISEYNIQCNSNCFINIIHKLDNEEKCINNCQDIFYQYEDDDICYDICNNSTQSLSTDENSCDKYFNNLANGEYNKKCDIEELFDYKCQLGDSDEIRDFIEMFIQKEIKNGNSDELIGKLLNNTRDNIIMEYRKVKYELVTTNIDDDYKDISIIKLGECEKKLRSKYNLTLDDPLVIFKLDINTDEFLIPLVEYEIYDLKNKRKLDLDICKDVTILYPCNIDENQEYKHNPSSDFYNDECFPYTTEKNTDIIIPDRRNEYIEKTMAVCEKDCEYEGYDSNTKKAKCQCNIKLNLPLVNEVVIDKDKLLSNFYDINKITNLIVMKCYSLLLTGEGMIFNIGNIVLLIIILLTIICMIIYIKKDYKTLYDLIDSFLFTKKVVNQDKDKKKINKKKKIKKKKVKKKKAKKNDNNNKKDQITNIKGRNIISKFTSPKTAKGNINENSTSKSVLMTVKQSKFMKNNNIINKQENDVDVDVIYNDFEMNIMIYLEAIKIDKRTYLEYYITLLERKQVILFTFFNHKDYNSRYVKICLFLFSIAIYYTLNAIFFTDDTMHNIYVEEGKYNFIYQLPHIIYSTLISAVISFLLKFLSLTEEDIVKYKNQEKSKTILKKCIKIKLIFYYIITLLLLVIFWFYVSCFCAVYKNTQIHLLKDTLISFGLSQLYPIGLCLLPGIFRITSLRAQKQDKSCIYALSKKIQNII